MPEGISTRLYEGVPTTSEAALFTAAWRTEVTAIHASGDATGGTVSLSVIPAGGTEAAANRICQATPVAAAASVDILTTGEEGFAGGFTLNPGDVISGLQSSGTHITLLIEGVTYGEA